MNKNILNEKKLQKEKNTEPLFLLDTDKINKEYFVSNNINDFNFYKLERMSNDFKIILLLIESYKDKNYKRDDKKNNKNK